MKITREQLKETLRNIMKEEAEYQQFFKKALEKSGKSITDMSDEEKKDFFNKIDAAWDGKGEKKNEGNAFGAAVTAAKEKGEDSFEVGGKTYKVEEARGLNKSYVMYLAVDKKLKELEAAQKEMAKQYFAEKDEKKKAALLDKLKQGTKVLQYTRKNLNDLETNYVMNLDKDAEYQGESVNEISLPDSASKLNYKHATYLEKMLNSSSGLKGYVDTDEYTDAIMYNASSGMNPTYTLYFGSNDDYGKPDEFRVSLLSTYGNDPSKLGKKIDKAFKSGDDAMKFMVAVAKKYKKELQMDDEPNESVNEGRAFINAAKKAKAEGKTEFEFNGKKYPVTIKD